MELYHYGVPGMKWGIRRYQNADGSLTSAGIKRYGRLVENSNNALKKSNEAFMKQPNNPTSFRRLAADLSEMRAYDKRRKFEKSIDVDAYARYKAGKERLDSFLKADKTSYKLATGPDRSYENNPEYRKAYAEVESFFSEYGNDPLILEWYSRTD